MRVLKVNRFWPALAVAFGAALVIVTAASADGVPFAATAVGGVAFAPYGSYTDIDQGDVTAAGGSGRFIVKDRHLRGVFVGPSLVGPYELTFGTNVPLETQSGEIHGKAVINTVTGPVEANVQASSTPGVCELPLLFGYPALLINGTYSFTSGAAGNGVLLACVTPDIDPLTGHILGLIAAEVELIGQTP